MNFSEQLMGMSKAQLVMLAQDNKIAIEALQAEVAKQSAALKVAKDALNRVADDGGNRKQYEAIVALAKINELEI